MNLRQRIGILKSRLIYDYRPFNRGKRKKLYAKFIGPGDLCLDIGAHTGNRCETWLDLEARVVALEPQPQFASIIRKKFSKRGKFVLIRKAISSRPGTAVLHLSWSNPAVSTIREHWVSVISEFDPRTTWDETMEIDVITLDDLIAEFGLPVFCKIDVEGGEADVLRGCTSALPALSFEFFPGRTDDAVACIDLLERNGRYGYNLSFTETFRFVLNGAVSAEEMKTILREYRGRRSGDIYAVLGTD